MQGISAGDELISLAPILKGKYLPVAIDLASSLQDPWDIARVFIKLSEKNDGDNDLLQKKKNRLLEKAYNAAMKIEDNYKKALAVRNLAPQFQEPRHSQLLIESRELGKHIEDIDSKGRFLLELAPLFPEEERLAVLSEAEETILKIESPESKAFLLADLLSHASEPKRYGILAETKKALKQIDPYTRTLIFIKLAPLLSDSEWLDTQSEAKSDLEKIEGIGAKVALYIDLLSARRFSEQEQAELCSAALDLVQNINNNQKLTQKKKDHNIANELINIAKYLPPSQIDKALDIAGAIKNGLHLAAAIAGLAPYMSKEHIEDSMALMQRKGPKYKAMALIAMIPYAKDPILKANLKEKAINAADSIKNPKERKSALLAIKFLSTEFLSTEHLPETYKYKLQQKTEYWKRLSRPGFYGYDRESFEFPEIPINYFKANLKEAKNIGGEGFYKVQSLGALAPHLPATLKIEALDEAYRTLDRIGDHEDLRNAAKSGLPPRPTELESYFGLSKFKRDEYIKNHLQEIANPPRYADITFYSGYNNKAIPDEEALQLGKPYKLEVAVRIKPTGICAEKVIRHPILEPLQKTEITILVTAEGQDFKIDEATQKLILPPSGDSTGNAKFTVYPLNITGNPNNLAKIRIRLFFEFNLLEVITVGKEVIGIFDDTIQSRFGSTLMQEPSKLNYNLDFKNIKPKEMQIYIEKENEKFRFHFTFLNKENRKIEFHATSPLTIIALGDSLINVRKALYKIALGKIYRKNLEASESDYQNCIRDLANAGRDLWTALFKIESKGALFNVGKWLKEHPLEPDSTIQIKIHPDAANFVFPWNLLYDKEIPSEYYNSVDPNGFWGLRYCIEQKLLNTDESCKSPKASKGLKLDFMLNEEFQNAEKEKKLLKDLELRTGGKLRISPPIINKNKCLDKLKEGKSNLFYFYTHGHAYHQEFDISNSELEEYIMNLEPTDSVRMFYEDIKNRGLKGAYIGLSDSYLSLNKLYDEVTEQLASGPFVFLNMCESAQMTPSLRQSFVHFFMDRGACSVLGTECPMTIEFAHPFAEEILRGMLLGDTIGNVLLNARRHFIDGYRNPLGLAYNLYGSTTLCFEQILQREITA